MVGMLQTTQSVRDKYNLDDSDDDDDGANDIPRPRKLTRNNSGETSWPPNAPVPASMARPGTGSGGSAPQVWPPVEPQGNLDSNSPPLPDQTNWDSTTVGPMAPATKAPTAASAANSSYSPPPATFPGAAPGSNHNDSSGALEFSPPVQTLGADLVVEVAGIHAKGLAVLPEVSKDKMASPEYCWKVGRWGEEAVYQMLKDKNGQVVWENATGETGKPYDITIRKKGEQIEKYIEVKATTGQSKSFDISVNELLWASKHRSKYVVYRVINAGGPELTFTKIRDPYKKLSENKHSISYSY